MNDLVYRQLVQRLIDRCLVSHLTFIYSFNEYRIVACQYAVASWNVPNCPGLWNTLLLLPCNTSGLIGAVFSSVGKPELPTPSGPNSLAGPTSLFEDPVQLDILHIELRSFCVFSDPIQIVARDQYYDEILNRVATSGSGPDLGSESDSNGVQSQTESPKVCKTPEQRQELAYTQPTGAQLVEPRIYPEPTGAPQQDFAFDFDFDSGVWVSTYCGAPTCA